MSDFSLHKQRTLVSASYNQTLHSASASLVSSQFSTFSRFSSYPLIILHGFLIPDTFPQLGSEKVSVFFTQYSIFKLF